MITLTVLRGSQVVHTERYTTFVPRVGDCWRMSHETGKGDREHRVLQVTWTRTPAEPTAWTAEVRLALEPEAQ